MPISANHALPRHGATTIGAPILARSRNIKPGFFKNEDLGTADPYVSLLFAGLWTLADRAGVLEDRPLRIKAEIFPYRDGLDINGYLTVLERLGYIRKFVVDGVKYIFIVNFSKHQNPHHTEKASGFPAYSDTCAVTVNSPLDHGENPAYSLIPDSGFLIPDSLPPIPPEGVVVVKKKPSINLEGFEPFWKVYPKQRLGSRQNAEKAYSKALARGHPPWAILEGVTAYAASREVAGGYAKGAAAWLNDDRFLNDYGDTNGTDRQVNKPTKTDRLNAAVERAIANSANFAGFTGAGGAGGDAPAMLSGPESVWEGAGTDRSGDQHSSNGAGPVPDRSGPRGLW